MVVSWHKTSSSCAKAAYVFVTKRGRSICVDPTHGWVKSHAAQVPGTSKKNTNA
ncbi:hypothetical protein ANANG_G00102860 [Anguilla anguilla]|uniref:Chemokine interleukin-8-like domain-containing protein n=1 Tax=Anguilla anguilla TaxID=7936 RepID=A0A9D3MGX8_ANGAN|nr:hypothetical protein ANANG_G00102860 [Anguilla anguilla]